MLFKDALAQITPPSFISSCTRLALQNQRGDSSNPITPPSLRHPFLNEWILVILALVQRQYELTCAIVSALHLTGLGALESRGSPGSAVQADLLFISLWILSPLLSFLSQHETGDQFVRLCGCVYIYLSVLLLLDMKGLNKFSFGQCCSTLITWVRDWSYGLTRECTGWTSKESFSPFSFNCTPVQRVAGGRLYFFFPSRSKAS